MCLTEKLDTPSPLSYTNIGTKGKEDHIEEEIRDFASLTRVFEITQKLGKCRLMVHDETPGEGSFK